MSSTDDSEPKQTGQHKPAPSFSRFTVRLFLYLFAASLLFSLGELHRRFGPLQRAMAAIVAKVAGALGVQSTVVGYVIHVREAALEINHECTGIFVLLVFATFVFAYPAPWSHRACGVFLGALVLSLVNLARLVLLVVIANAKPAWFGYFHEYFFQGVFIALLAFLAAGWTEWVRRATVGRVPG